MSPGIRRALRAALAAAALLMGGSAAVLLALRWSGWQSGPLIPLVTFTPYAVVPALVAALLLLAVRARRSAAAAATVCCALVLTQAPLYVAADVQTGTSPAWTLTVMTSNLMGGATNAPAFVELVRDSDVDVLMVQELSVWQARELDAAGIGALLPHQALLAATEGAGGSGIYSRYPLGDVTTWPEFFSAQVQARLDLPGDVANPLVVSVHPTTVSPRENDGWVREQAALRERLRALSGPVIVAGDFNATYDHKAFRRYLAEGYTDAVEATGTGLLRTWPARHHLFPAPFAGIDHVLTRSGVTPESARSVHVRNSDHLAVVARVSGAR